MVVTAWLKTILLAWGLAGLMQGVAASLNYSLGFVAIQLTGSSPGDETTPANTALRLGGADAQRPRAGGDGTPGG